MSIGDIIVQLEMILTYALNQSHRRRSLQLADKMLSIHQGMVKLDSVWGEGGGNRPVKSLIRQIRNFILEYHNSKDITEAMQCLNDLNVPHFHHEVVYEVLHHQQPRLLLALLSYYVSENMIKFHILLNHFPF